MLTDAQIINLGLSKISSSRIGRIDPPKSPLENFMAINYPQWKRFELTKRRWVFATEDDYILTMTDVRDNVRQPYVYVLPNDCLRPIRTKCTEWKQRGRNIYSAYDSLSIDYIRDVAEAEFDPLFTELLACKVAWGSAEFVTQSTTKKQDAETEYEESVRTAGQANAYVIGAEDIAGDDSTFDWLDVRSQGS